MNEEDVTQTLAAARKRPVKPEKMLKMLGKIRKGALAWIDMKNVVQVIDRIGWKVEPIKEWVLNQDRESLTSYRAYGSSIEARELRMNMKKAEVSVLSTNVTLGSPIYRNVSEVMRVEKICPTRVTYDFSFEEWCPVLGLLFTCPNGEKVKYLPRTYERFEDCVKLGHQAAKLLNQPGGWLPYVNMVLGTPEHVAADKRTRENTGTCVACWGNFKLENGVLVLHGYERPGIGHVNGRCLCVGYEPLETSKDGAIVWLFHLESMLMAIEKHLYDLKSGEVTKFLNVFGIFVKKGEASFEMQLKEVIHQIEGRIPDVKSEISDYEKVIAAWVMRPLPNEGELQRDMLYFLPPTVT